MNGASRERSGSTWRADLRNLQRAIPPARDGVSASCVALPSLALRQSGAWRTVLDFLCERFAAISRDEWLARMGAGDVSDDAGERVTPESLFVPHKKIYYYRSVPGELRIPFEERVLFHDDYIVVADKPHFLPVVPSGRFVQETLLVRLKRKLGIDTLSPAHRIDRDTAGLVLFTIQPATRDAYQRLFRDRSVAKRYEAIAPVAPIHADLKFPMTYRSRLQESDAFMQMREGAGAPNAETRIDVIETYGAFARYALTPVTGQKHQLRAHMAALGIPIVNDCIYPTLLAENRADDFDRPLQLLAKALAFVDPLTGQTRSFTSKRGLSPISRP